MKVTTNGRITLDSFPNEEWKIIRVEKWKRETENNEIKDTIVYENDPSFVKEFKGYLITPTAMKSGKTWIFTTGTYTTMDGAYFYKIHAIGGFLRAWHDP